jgi:predicted RNA methylase
MAELSASLLEPTNRECRIFMPNNEWGDFQTPSDLADLVFGALGDQGWTRVLEPTCGLGSFLVASSRLGETVERLGIEIQPDYVELAAQIDGVSVLSSSIFDLNLARDLPWRSEGALLVVGNPPWVTSSQLGSLGSA